MPPKFFFTRAALCQICKLECPVREDAERIADAASGCPHRKWRPIDMSRYSEAFGDNPAPV